jgi:hypothetical protein
VSAPTPTAWALLGHLRPFWGERRPSEVTPQLVDRFRRKTLAEAEALRAADQGRGEADGGALTRAPRRRRAGDAKAAAQAAQPAVDQRALIQTLATLLDVAVERSDVAFGANAARGPRRRIRLVQPAVRSFLEVDQVWALLDAASARERRLAEHRSDACPCGVILSSLTLGGRLPRGRRLTSPRKSCK